MTTFQSIEKQADRVITAFTEISCSPYVSNMMVIKERHELTKPQILTLTQIVQKNGCKMSELSKLTGMASSALTGIIDRLMDKNLVRRERDLEDRRIVKVFATEEGASIANEFYQACLFTVKQILSKIEPDYRENFVSQLEKIARTFTIK